MAAPYPIDAANDSVWLMDAVVDYMPGTHYVAHGIKFCTQVQEQFAFTKTMLKNAEFVTNLSHTAMVAGVADE